MNTTHHYTPRPAVRVEKSYLDRIALVRVQGGQWNNMITLVKSEEDLEYINTKFRELEMEESIANKRTKFLEGRAIQQRDQTAHNVLSAILGS